MKLNTPAFRLSVALTVLTVNLLFLANQLGLVTDASEQILVVRKGLSESLAVQFAAAAAQGELSIIRTTLREVVERNKDIRSAVIRADNGELIAMAGEHLSTWHPPPDGRSTPTHINVPVFKGDKQWATVELSFTPLWTDNLVLGWGNTFIRLLAYMTLAGFIGIFLIVRWTLRELDPKAVIPERVQKAFNILQEGVLILDQKEQIVLANTSIAAMIGKSPESLIGLKGSELAWLDMPTSVQRTQLPWLQVLKDGKDREGMALRLHNERGDAIKLMVSATVVADEAGRCRGTLVTFDDITQLEEKNFELQSMLEQLQLANAEILLKSQELEVLANCDPLTLCFNRRAFSLQFRDLFTEAKTAGSPLSCLMVDIDFFKSVNDRFGHATGDQVIKAVADVLKTSTRDTDLVGRYGGEEFCVVLPGLPQEKSVEIAERIRKTMESQSCAGVNITLSLGVATLNEQVNKPDELINQADKALYAAKNSGRNRVVRWGSEGNEQTTVVAPTTPAASRNNQDTAGVAELKRLQYRVQELEATLEKRSLEIEHLSMFDAQTGLPTRLLFEDRIAREIARGMRKHYLVAVLSMTIDTIKRVHETMGYSMAEQLVHACAHRLNDVLREDFDTVAVIQDVQETTTISMIGATEFGILLANIRQVDQITWVVKRILDAFAKPFTLQGQELYAAAFIGISLYPNDGQTVETLYSGAANASRFARELKGKERYLFCSQSLNDMAISQLTIENRLHEAIDNNELRLVYQPKIVSASGTVAGFEALLQWKSETLGVVPPDKFIRVAEQSGQINSIGDWVIKNACRQLRAWIDVGLSVVPIAINISGLQLHQAHLVDRIQTYLATYDLSPDLLEIELTESSLINTDKAAIALLQQIQAAGLRISMDDFGTGYSSLSYLRNLPLACLKIDRSFVRDIGTDLHANKLVASIISMAHELGLEVVAEGVEELHQAEYLAGLQCNYLQGYYFSRPVPEEAAVRILQQPVFVLQGNLGSIIQEDRHAAATSQ